MTSVKLHSVYSSNPKPEVLRLLHPNILNRAALIEFFTWIDSLIRNSTTAETSEINRKIFLDSIPIEEAREIIRDAHRLAHPLDYVSIAELEASVRLTNVLELEGITTAGDILDRSLDDLSKLRGFGKVSQSELFERLSISAGIKFDRPIEEMDKSLPLITFVAPKEPS